MGAKSRSIECSTTNATEAYENELLAFNLLKQTKAVNTTDELPADMRAAIAATRVSDGYRVCTLMAGIFTCWHSLFFVHVQTMIGRRAFTGPRDFTSEEITGATATAGGVNSTNLILTFKIAVPASPRPVSTMRFTVTSFPPPPRSPISAKIKSMKLDRTPYLLHDNTVTVVWNVSDVIDWTKVEYDRSQPRIWTFATPNVVFSITPTTVFGETDPEAIPLSQGRT